MHSPFLNILGHHWWWIYVPTDWELQEGRARVVPVIAGFPVP